MENSSTPKHCPFNIADPYKMKDEFFLVILAVMIERNDDLPAPEGPMIVKNSPDRTDPLKLFRIVFFLG